MLSHLPLISSPPTYFSSSLKRRQPWMMCCQQCFWPKDCSMSILLHHLLSSAMSSDLKLFSVFSHVLAEGALTDMLESQLLAPREPSRQGRCPSASSIKALISGFLGGSWRQNHEGIGEIGLRFHWSLVRLLSWLPTGLCRQSAR